MNGAGKTSTLEVIEGLARPSAGEVRVLGMDPIKERAAVRRRTGVLLQRSGFVADLTVAETLQMWAATVTERAARSRSRSRCSTSTTGPAPGCASLSGGEQRRVDLACALMGRPDVVMLDEPTTGLDPESRRQVWRLIRGLRDEGATVLLTTHYLEEAEALADELSIMRAGVIVRSGTPAQIVADHPSEISFRTPGPDCPAPVSERPDQRRRRAARSCTSTTSSRALTDAAPLGRGVRRPAGPARRPHRQPRVGVPRHRRRTQAVRPASSR